MGSVDIRRIIKSVAFLILYTKSDSLRIKEEAFEKNMAKCMELATHPYFDIGQVVGKSWRIYYTWNAKMENKCLDMTFKNATTLVINRFYHDMYEYLEQQPNWDAATLVVTMGTAKHELLLFADQGPAGMFIGVPNVVRDGNITPVRKGVPILKFFLKLLQNGAYLLMTDCNIGVTSLSARERPPYRAEVASVADSLPLGIGDPACVADKKQGEQMFL